MSDSKHIRVNVHTDTCSSVDVSLSIPAPAARTLDSPLPLFMCRRCEHAHTPAPGVGVSHMRGPADLHKMKYMVAVCRCGNAIHMYTRNNVVMGVMVCNDCGFEMPVDLVHHGC